MMDCETKTENNNVLFIPVPNIKLCDLLDWQDPEQRKHRHIVQCSDLKNELKVSLESLPESHIHRKCFGKSVNVNDETIALFRIGVDAYATQAKCPHMGGPLQLADIEELVPGHVSLRCPWHKWTFSLDTGHSISPPGRNLQARTYPVKVEPSGEIRIGFNNFGPSAFLQDDF